MKIKTLGTSCTVTSSLTLEAIKKLEKFQPAVLLSVDENKNPVFKVATGKVASFSANGIVFDSANASGLAQITFPIPNTGDKKKFVVETYGTGIARFTEVEAHITAQYTALETQFTNIENSIEDVE